MSQNRGRNAGLIVAFALAGILLGGLIGLALSPGNELRKHHDPQAQTMGMLLMPFEILLKVTFIVAGAGIGCALGATAGAVLCAAQAKPTPEKLSELTTPAATELPTEELAKLEAAKARIQERIDAIQSPDQT